MAYIYYTILMVYILRLCYICYIKPSMPTMLQSGYEWIYSHLLTDTQATSMSMCKDSDHHSSVPKRKKCLLLLCR